MNDKYFFCMDCHEYVNAGYRWSYHQLEKPGTLELETIIDPRSVIEAKEYWSCETEHLADVLKAAKIFLQRHKNHQVRYSDFQFVFESDEHPWYLWLCCDDSDDSEHLPRHFIEREGVTSFTKMRSIVEERERTAAPEHKGEAEDLRCSDEDSLKLLEAHWDELVRKYGSKSNT
mgnify:CR=1 FL=1